MNHDSGEKTFRGEAEAELAALRVPPHSIEAEQSVLGGLLLDNLAFDQLADLLHADDFYRYEHREIFRAVSQLVIEAKPADVITVFEHLKARRIADDCGGLAYLNALAQSVPSAANSRRYAEIVRERAVLRRLIEAGDTLIGSALRPMGRPVSQILDEAETLVMRIGEDGAKG